MPASRHYDTVAFDVRDNAAMLFFAKTSSEGDIDDYLLLMRTIESDFSEITWVEINEQQFGGEELILEARLLNGTLELTFNEPVELLEGERKLALSFADTPENGRSIEQGAFRVLGDVLTGGNA